MSGNETAVGPDRRQVLKAIGATSGLTVLSGLAQATKVEGHQQYRGLSYDTRTHIEQAPARATLDFSGGTAKGHLKVAGFEIPVGKSEPEGVEPTNEDEHLVSYSFKLNEERFTKEGLPLEVSFQTNYTDIVGTLTRPSGRYSRLSFSLKAVDEGGRPELVRGALNNKKIKNPPKIPETGIPQSTAVSQITNPQTSRNPESGGSVSIQADDYDGASVEVVDEAFNYDFSSYDSQYDAQADCPDDTQVYNHYEYALAHSTLADADYTPDELPNGNRRMIFLHAFFEQVPTNLIADNCSVVDDYDEPAPLAVDYSVKTDNIDETDLDNMFPQESDSDQSLNNWVNASLSIAGTLLGTWGSIGSTLVKLALKSDSTSDLTTEVNEDFTSKEYTWGIQLDSSQRGSDGLPTGRDETSTVRCQLVNGNLDTGEQTNVSISSQFTFQYPSHNTYCPCEYTFVNDAITVDSTAELTIAD